MSDNQFSKNGQYLYDEDSLTRLPRTPRNISPGTGDFINSIRAEDEWISNPKLAMDKFLHTSAYKDFTQKNMLILLGKTGDGKTSILKNIENLINSSDKSNKNLMAYDNAIAINFERFLAELAIDNDMHTLSSDLELEQLVYNSIEAFIYITIMKHLAEDSQTNIPLIKKFLAKKKISELFSGLFTSLELEQSNTPYVKEIFYGIKNLLKILSEAGYDEALDELLKISRKGKNILLLIDTMPEYNMRNSEMIMVMRLLIKHIFSFHERSSKDNIFVKAAMPYEIYKDVIKVLPARNMGNMTVINWTNKQLITLAALCIVAKYNSGSLHNNDHFSFCNNFAIDDFYEDSAYDNAIKLLENIIPLEHKTNATSFSIPGLMYLIRHTTLKARDVIYLINELCNAIDDNGTKYYDGEYNAIFSRDVHSCMEFMITSALSMYVPTYGGILYEAVEMIFTGQKFILTGKEIFSLILNHRTALLQRAIEMSRVARITDATESTELLLGEPEHNFLGKIQEILLESGLLGGIKGIHEVKKNNKQFKNKEDMCLLVVDFGKDNTTRMIANDDTQYIMHPICYEYYGCRYNLNTLVYQTGSYQEEWLLATLGD